MNRPPHPFVQPLPFSEACERNKGPILEVLQRWLGHQAGLVLEIGAGTGQHAVHFARHLPRLSWQPTEQLEASASLAARIEIEGSCNLLPPFELDVEQGTWPCDADSVDAVYTANTLHIVSWPQVQAMFRGVGRVLRATTACWSSTVLPVTAGSSRRTAMWLSTSRYAGAIR